MRHALVTEIRLLEHGDLEQVWELEHDAFRVPLERRDPFLRQPHVERGVGAFVEGRLVAMILVIPFGQFFAARAVPMGGVASVVVRPEMRGSGIATRLLRETIGVMRERGFAISTLRPATTGLYRRSGWEIAGAQVYRAVAARTLAGLPRPSSSSSRVRAGSMAELDGMRACYARLARESNGFLDRGARWDYYAEIWRERSIFVAEGEGGEIDGYLVYGKIDGPTSHLGGPFEIAVDDVIAATPDAHHALWRLLGSWSAQADKIHYLGAAEDPLLLGLPEQELLVEAEVRWMTRIVDAAAAVGTRGYPAGLRAHVKIDVDDPVVAENRGSFTLSVQDGCGALERCAKSVGVDVIRLDVGALASLYTGWASTSMLARAGRLGGGSEPARAALDAIFAGPAPWMADSF